MPPILPPVRKKSHRPPPLNLQPPLVPIPGSTLSSYRPRHQPHPGRRPSTVPEEEADPTSVERLFHDAESVESYESDSTESMYSTQSLPENESPQVRAHRQWGNRDESGMATPGIISRIEEVLYSPRSPEWGEPGPEPKYTRILGSVPLAPSSPQPLHSPVGSHMRPTFYPHPLDQRAGYKVKSVLGIGMEFPSPVASPIRPKHKPICVTFANAKPPSGFPRVPTRAGKEGEEHGLTANPRAKFALHGLMCDLEASDEESKSPVGFELKPWGPLNISRKKHVPEPEQDEDKSVPKAPPPTPVTMIGRARLAQKTRLPLEEITELEVCGSLPHLQYTQSEVELLAPVAYAPDQPPASQRSTSPDRPSTDSSEGEEIPISLAPLRIDESNPSPTKSEARLSGELRPASRWSAYSNDETPFRGRLSRSSVFRDVKDGLKKMVSASSDWRTSDWRTSSCTTDTTTTSSSAFRTPFKRNSHSSAGSTDPGGGSSRGSKRASSVFSFSSPSYVFSHTRSAAYTSPPRLAATTPRSIPPPLQHEKEKRSSRTSLADVFGRALRGKVDKQQRRRDEMKRSIRIVGLGHGNDQGSSVDGNVDGIERRGTGGWV